MHQEEIILALLQKFYITVQVSVNTKYFDEDDGYDPPKDDRVFVVPSMLMYNEKEIYDQQAGDIYICCSAIPLSILINFYLRMFLTMCW